MLSAMTKLHCLQYVVLVGDRFVLVFQAGEYYLFYFGSMSCFGECSLDCIGVKIITNNNVLVSTTACAGITSSEVRICGTFIFSSNGNETVLGLLIVVRWFKFDVMWSWTG